MCLPEILQVLHPLKEADSDTSCIGVDVRKDNNATIPQNLVALHEIKWLHQLLHMAAAMHTS